jgi:hypothetical protein
MDKKFAAFVETLAPKLTLLLAMPTLKYGALPLDMPLCGVYLFSEGTRHLYVGRSNNLIEKTSSTRTRRASVDKRSSTAASSTFLSIPSTVSAEALLARMRAKVEGLCQERVDPVAAAGAPRCAAAGIRIALWWGREARSRTGSGGAECASRIPTYRRLQSQTHGGPKRP